MSVTDKGSMKIKLPQRCLNFGGTNETDYVQINSDIVIPTSTPFTVSSWIYWNIEESDVGWIGNDTAYTDGRIHFADNDHISFWGTGENEITLNNPLPIETWFHLCCTRDSNDDFRVYLNGTSNGSTDTDAPGYFYIRRIGDSPINSEYKAINAKIYDVQIWSSSCLTDSQIEQLYNGINLSPDVKFNFDEREGDTVYDSVGNYTGTINGNVTWSDRDVRCWNTRWDEGNWDITIETFMDPNDRNLLFSSVTPRAVSELYNILGRPTFIDTTYTSSNTLILEPIYGYGLSSLCQRRKIGVKSISDSFISPNYFGIKFEGSILDD